MSYLLFALVIGIVGVAIIDINLGHWAVVGVFLCLWSNNITTRHKGGE